MSRPKEPLISKRVTLERALRIIDEEGLHELSIRRLARDLNINGASLYHHFRNKDEILLGAAKLALEHARTPEAGKADWRAWFIETSRIYRRALVDHPALLPVILAGHPHRVSPRFYDSAVRLLRDNGVPQPSIIPLIESVESFTLGAVLYSNAIRGGILESPEPLLALEEAGRHAGSHVDAEHLWESVAAAIIEAVLSTADAGSTSRQQGRRDIGMDVDEVGAIVRSCRTMCVSTLNRDGTIHSAAMWFGFFGDDVTFATRPKSQKVRNLVRNPTVTCLFENGSRTLGERRGVQIVGRARFLEDPQERFDAARAAYERNNGPCADRSVIERIVASRVVIVVEPRRIVSWDHTRLEPAVRGGGVADPITVRLGSGSSAAGARNEGA